MGILSSSATIFCPKFLHITVITVNAQFLHISSEIGKWKRKIDFKLVVTCHQQATGYTVRDKSKPRKRSWEIFHICIWNEPICSIDDYQ
ncbi:hypothetical protein T02_13228 [Trichinella nativa]|uniref:Uncharacterized protein n=2 Tax=Trichinella TaxID=6333 RepID=A0A0V1L3C6_9BILA|nr:hypothetical protein T05_12216 [Trichinella murrelli]KRZ54035.1 hypothetical protein T02_13228 [Trichinella nativa]